MPNPKPNPQDNDLPEIEVDAETQRLLDQMNQRHKDSTTRLEKMRKIQQESTAQGIPVFGELAEGALMVHTSVDYDPIGGVADLLVKIMPETAPDDLQLVPPIRILMKRLGPGAWIILPMDPNDPDNHEVPPWALTGHKEVAENIAKHFDDQHVAGKYPPVLWDRPVSREQMEEVAPMAAHGLRLVAKSKPLPRDDGDGDIQLPPSPWAA
jgi:hypothetical protein